MKSLEIFAGAGGLAIGEAIAGFGHEALLEWDSHSCEALRRNILQPSWRFGDWKIIQDDIRNISFASFREVVDIVSGGPPCQPFSIGGKHKGSQDTRDMFPQAARVVAEIAPKAFIFENVRGLLRESFSQYFDYIIYRLRYPEEVRGKSESWQQHLTRLERIHTKGQYAGLHYTVLHRLLNAADFGVPQQRQRVFIVGFRSDLHVPWSFPAETHSENALLVSKWITKEYWEENQVPFRKRPDISISEERRISQLKLPLHDRWRTVRDAISTLPDPRSRAAASFQGHQFQPGAKPYPGHTGSSLDLPAKTLKAGDHGVPGGENMLCLPDGSYRYFTVRESARLQTFPDDYVFPTSWTESMRQIGNAVPVRLASVIAKSVREALQKNEALKQGN